MRSIYSLTLSPQRRALDRIGEQHLLREDQIRAVVIGHLVVVPHRDRVERARHLAVAAEDAAAEIDLVHGGVALTGRDPVLGRVLGGHDTNAVRRAGRGAERAADALLQPGVLEPVQLVATSVALVDGSLVLGVLDRDRARSESRERRLQPAKRLAERAIGATERAGRGGADHLDHVGAGVVRGGHEATTIAVTTRFRVASGSSIFQPSDISWS